jgi:hypothetical protein
MISNISIANLPFFFRAQRARACEWGQSRLFLQDAFNLADFLLDFASEFFVLALSR